MVDEQWDRYRQSQVYINGNYSYSLTDIWWSKNLTVRNGLVRGDRVKPVSYGFQIIEKQKTRNGTNLHTSKSSGQITLQQGLLYGNPLPDPQAASGIGGGHSYVNPALRQVAMSKLISQMVDDNNLIVDLLEAPATVAMFRGINSWNNRIASSLDLLRRDVDHGWRNRRRFGSRPISDKKRYMLEAATSRWLEARYGIMPSASSLFGAYETFNKQFESLTVTLEATSALRSTGVVDWSASVPGGTVPGQGKWSKSERVKVKCEFYSPGSGVWNYTSLNPLLVAWELVPFSFIADWFLSIGQSLEYLEKFALYNHAFRSGHATHTAKYECTFTQAGTVEDATDRTFLYDQGVTSQKVKNREVLTQMPLPSLPRFRSNFNATKMMDLVSLGHQAMLGKLRTLGVSRRL